MAGVIERINKKIPAVLLETGRTFSKIRASQLAAAFAYYAFFSIFPMIALLLWLGAVFFQPEEVREVLEEFLAVGGDEGQLVWDGVRALQAAHGSLNVIFGGVLVWAGMRFFQVLVHGVNLAWHMVDLPWWQQMLKNLAMVFTLFSALLLGVITPMLLQIGRNTLQAFLEMAQMHFPKVEWGSYIHLADIARYGLATVCLFYAFVILFMLAPRRRVHFREVWLSALIVSVLLQAGQIFFVNYVPLFLRYNAIYGTVGSVMLLLLTIYIAGVVILTGACYCAARYRIRHPEEAEEPIPSTPEH